jgi:threonine dehydrogenase-like Zn-dependent dehydrogenase
MPRLSLQAAPGTNITSASTVIAVLIPVLRREITIYGTWNSKTVPTGNDDWSTVLNYMDKEFQVAPLISDIVPIEQGKEIFDSIVEKRKFHNKVIIQLTKEL